MTKNQEAEFDLAIATFEAGQHTKGLKMLKSLAKKGFSAAIWEMFNLSVNSNDLRGARKWLKQEKDPAMLAMLEAVLAEAESGIDVSLYEKAYEYGHAGAAYHLAKYYASIGDLQKGKVWASKTTAMGTLDEGLIAELTELFPDQMSKFSGLSTEDNKVLEEEEIDELNQLLDHAEFSDSVDALNDLLDKHWSCFTTGPECKICRRIDYLLEQDALDSGVSLLEKLAMNEKSSDVLDRVFEAAESFDSERGTSFRAIEIMTFLNSNSAVSERIRRTAFDKDWWLARLSKDEERTLSSSITCFEDMAFLAENEDDYWEANSESMREMFKELSHRLSHQGPSTTRKELMEVLADLVDSL